MDDLRRLLMDCGPGALFIAYSARIALQWLRPHPWADLRAADGR